MRNNTYKLTFWLRRDVEVNSFENKLLAIFNEKEIEILKKNAAKIKNLAYPIKKERSGQLVSIYFKTEPENILFLKEKLIKLDEILRFIIVKTKSFKGVKFLEEVKKYSMTEVASNNQTNQNQIELT